MIHIVVSHPIRSEFEHDMFILALRVGSRIEPEFSRAEPAQL